MEKSPVRQRSLEYARRVVEQITLLLDAHVPPESITVVGASKGAAIAVTVSSLLKNEQMNFVLSGTCHPSLIEEWKQQQLSLFGNVLAIYDSVDTEYAGSCQEWYQFSEGKGLARHDEIVLHTDAGHGILYQPLDAWILPTVQWAMRIPYVLPALDAGLAPGVASPFICSLNSLMALAAPLTIIHTDSNAHFYRPSHSPSCYICKRRLSCPRFP